MQNGSGPSLATAAVPLFSRITDRKVQTPGSQREPDQFVWRKLRVVVDRQMYVGEPELRGVSAKMQLVGNQTQ